MSRFSSLNRRAFLKTSAGAGMAAMALPALAAPESANEKLNIAVVGPGGRGYGNLKGVAGENIVALCDVDARRAGKAFEEFPKAKRYVDFRKMLSDLDKQIDAVVVSTPDHTHAPPAVMAMKMGKHCYCEKPLAHEVYEVRVMRDIAKKNNLATQMGTQIHAGDNYRRVVELVRAGAIGPIDEVHVWSAAKYGNVQRPTETPPVPEGLDWDLWLGPAPYRPYHPCYVPFAWRGWLDFGSGGLGDFGCHYGDLPFWALDLRYPTTVKTVGPPQHPEATPIGLVVDYTYPARGKMPPVKLTWYDGGKRPSLLKQISDKYDQGKEKKGGLMWGSGVLFVGSGGMLLADYSRHVLLPEEKFADYKRPEPTIPSSIGHHKEWIQACKTGEPTTCNFDYSGALSEAVLLGMVSYRVGQELQWDAKQLKATNCPEADRFIRRTYREGWTL